MEVLSQYFRRKRPINSLIYSDKTVLREMQRLTKIDKPDITYHK